MNSLDVFKEIALRDQPLAGYTWMKIGGPAQFLVRPRNVDELRDRFWRGRRLRLLTCQKEKGKQRRGEGPEF